MSEIVLCVYMLLYSSLHLLCIQDTRVVRIMHSYTVRGVGSLESSLEDLHGSLG